MVKNMTSQEKKDKSQPLERIKTFHNAVESTYFNFPGAISEDEGFLNWAVGSVSVPNQKEALEVTPQFQHSMKHKMLCWDVFHGERHKATERPKKEKPSGKFANASQSFFGLRNFLSVDQRRRSCWGGNDDAFKNPTDAWNNSVLKEKWMNSTGTSVGSTSNLTKKSDLSNNPSFKSMSSTADLNKSMSSIAPAEQDGDLWELRLEEGMDCSLWEESLWDDAIKGPDLKSARLPSRGQTRDVRPGGHLRQPPAFVEPHRNLQIQDAQHTPEFVYFRHCDMAGRVPFASVWRQFGEGIVDVSGKAVTDPDLQVITKTVLECATEGKKTKVFDASGNQITDEGLHGFVRGLLENKDAGDSLQSLSFAKNPVAMQHVPMINDFSKALRALPNLISFDISGILLCDTRQGLAGNAARDNKKSRIIPRHLQLAVRNDEELNKLLGSVTIASGGVLPNIHAVLLPKKSKGK
jgi:hypothetical protein